MLEDREEYVGRLSEEERAAMQRAPFPVLALVNPRLSALGHEGARFFEGCLSVPGYQVGLAGWLAGAQKCVQLGQWTVRVRACLWEHMLPGTSACMGRASQRMGSPAPPALSCRNSMKVHLALRASCGHRSSTTQAHGCPSAPALSSPAALQQPGAFMHAQAPPQLPDCRRLWSGTLGCAVML